MKSLRKWTSLSLGGVGAPELQMRQFLDEMIKEMDLSEPGGTTVSPRREGDHMECQGSLCERHVCVCKRIKWWQTTLPLTNSCKFLSSAVWAANALWSLPRTRTPESCQEITRNSTEHSQRCLRDSPAAVVPAEMSGHDSGVHVGGNDHSAFAAQTAEERNLQEFVNGRVVCHHLVRLQTQTCLSQRLP